MGTEGGDSEAGATPSRSVAEERGPISKKVIAAVAVALILGVSGFYVWYEYYRHWSISDLEDAAIVEETEYGFPTVLGFESGLAGKTVIVEGTVSSARGFNTSLGHLTYVFLEGGEFCGLTLWNSSVPAEGDKVEIPVTFERATINGIEGVYSPDTIVPGYWSFATLGMVIQSVSWIWAEFALDVEDLGDEVVLKIERCSDPVPLESVSCDLRAGDEVGMMEYYDLLYFYRDNPCNDAIPDLSIGDSLNGTMDFSDADGYLDDGDSFTLRNLTRPDTESGAQTYLLRVERDRYAFEEYDEDPEYVFFAYLIMTKNGVLWGTTQEGFASPGSAFSYDIPDGRAMTVDYLAEPVSWNSSILQFDTGAELAEWEPPVGFLGSGSAGTQSLGVRSTQDLTVECIVTDLEGNGLIDIQDRIEFVARDGTSLEVGEGYWMGVRYKPTFEYVIRESFLYLADPTSGCAMTVGEELASVVFGPVHNGTGEDYEDVDVAWGEVLVRLESDGNLTEWHLTTEDLMGEGRSSWESEEIPFGSMSLVCAVTDLQGNGVVNTGDVVELKPVLPGESFDGGTEYTLSFLYLPTGSTIFYETFTGAT
jgi:hypothetical protein